MSETAARTQFVSTVNGKKVFSEWTVINTSLGMMIEPVNMICRYPNDGTAYDPSDSFSMVTEIREVDLNQLAAMPPFADVDGTRLHGGYSNPRTGF